MHKQMMFMLNIISIGQQFEIVEVTIRGPVDRKTGMVMNITELKEYMEQAIMNPLDHKNLDRDVEFFEDQVILSSNFQIQKSHSIFSGNVYSTN